MGKIPKGKIYRGAYPVFKIDPERDEAYSQLVSEAGIKRIASLAPWYDALLKKNNVIGLDIQFDFDFENKFEKDIFNYRLRKGFQLLTAHEGPYLIQCNAGRDRTGFVAAIIELLCGANIDEIICDYLLSYGIEFAATKNELNFITGQIIYGQINAIVKGKIKDSDNLQANIEKYFLDDIGLTGKEVTELKRVLIGFGH